ncbi:MAG: ribosome biogenesis/translation initiation ATPase RLI [Nanobdellota archaeon]
MRNRIMVVKKDKCNPDGCGGYLCMKVSPSNRMGKDAIVKSDDGKVEVNEDVITDADRIAANKCPFGALEMIRLPEELDKDPVHRFGKNGFALYNLPTPIFGKVVGIIGRNGIGKSTAIKVLSDVLKPNFGKEGHEADDDALIEHFKGTEAQKYFEKRKSGEIKVSYKPQAVDMLPKTAKGKVGDLLKKVDERGIYDSIIKDLDLEDILDNDLSSVSGGELQRVAIAATVMKKANVYVFDEPTSYLDIKQRIRVSRYIRDMADENTAVLVIEHDLIILDYMTDLIHLMYGKEEGYGIVSLMKSTKQGINIYLEGYMKDENMRFRDHKIHFFDEAPVKKEKEQKLLSSWKDVRKKLGKFSLSAEGGQINTRETIGILGENGIGKTSFVKMLAGVDEADEGEINEDISVAYKPQYLKGSEKTVMEFLGDAVKKYKGQIIDPLDIEKFFFKKLNELSGGQLQKVAIAHCLSRDADLFLFDEPSAYLDVEQRLILSKVIREVMEAKGTSALIVDHDLLFVDYLSQKIMVFDGKPAIKGVAKGPYPMAEGMNTFLKDIDTTMRRDPENNRPRVNKPGSQMDRKQKGEDKLYYTS